MKPLLTLLLLCSPVLADNRVSVPVPRDAFLYLTWGELPYPDHPWERQLDDGRKYRISNPNGVGCHPRFGGGDVFRVHVMLWLDQVTIIGGREINPVW